MKNFSTVSVRLAVAALFAAVVAVPAAAADCAFKPNAPDQHTVVKGDTLWGISGTFLERPWCWPQVWGMNKEEIKNPHWIYPGQVIYLDRANGRLSLNKPGAGDGSGNEAAGSASGDVRIAPQLRTEGLGKDAVQSISPTAIEPFLSQPLIVEADDMPGAPRVVATEEGHVYVGRDSKAYVLGDLRDSTSFQVYRPGTPLKDPVNGQLLGYEAFYLGTMKLVKASKNGGEAHTFLATTAKQEIGVGDLLMPSPPTGLRNYVPHPPASMVDGRVVSVYGSIGEAAQNDVISISRGALDGVDVGTVLELYHLGRTVTDPAASKGMFNLKNPTVKLPDERVGTVFIFRVFKHISYGLIMQVTDPIRVGDVVTSPE